ncbi:hypothetical protein F2Q70_00034722 [Brassica cretica]|uniref:Ribophorin II n=1 Tax=Brassica cretica TaxID=69181 RepID=A0A8S9JTN9_BRACR|nr:hypothetical protein F2Q70_00034722 [Brassica cretica]
MMERGLVRFLFLILAVAICGAASVFQPISDSHRSAALDVFVPVDGSYKSLEEAYEALKTLEILGIDKKSDLSSATCENVVKVLALSSSTLKDALYALSVNGILKCKSGEDVPKDIVSKLQTGVKEAKLLLDFYYSVRGLVLVKEQFSGTHISLGDAEAVFRSIKALSQSDGKWRYSPNNPESSTFAAGLAFETLAGVISLAPSEIDHSLIQTLKTGITKLFDSIQKYDDGTFYFDESEGPISTTASVIRGLKSFAASESTGLNLPGEKIVGLAKFFLGVGIPVIGDCSFPLTRLLSAASASFGGGFVALQGLDCLELGFSLGGSARVAFLEEVVTHSDGRRSRSISSLVTRRSNLRCSFSVSAHLRLSPIRGSRCLRTSQWILQEVGFSEKIHTLISLEEAYEAFKALEILGIDKKSDLSSATCENVVKVLASPSSSTLKDAFYALSVNGILKCKSGEDVPKDIVSKLQAGVKDAKLLLDFYYSVKGLVLVKEQFSGTDISLGDAEAVFRSIKALSQSDGRWLYSSNNPESSTFAAGLALETLAGVISLAPSEIDQSLIQTLKTGITKLFDSIQKYDDGTFYFDESEGPISTTASVIRGLKSFAASESTGLNLPGEKIVGLAKFFLGVGIPGDAKDFFNQIDALACLEDNRFSVPLILSLPSSVISLTKKEPLKVKVSTVLGSKAPALSVKLAQALSSGSKGSSVINNQELKFDAESATYFLESFPKNFDVGKYTFVFEILLDESANEKAYITEAQTKVPIAATGAITIENAEIAVLDSDVGSVESQKKLDLTKDEAVSLSANHLQKLRLSFQLTTPIGHVFKPHQAFLKLKHESQVEHIFLVKTSGKKSELFLDFLGLVEKLYYLSGKYEIQLTIGDASMENSLLSNIGHIELDLPERPEKAARPPLQPTDPYSRYVPKAEISHIFRIPEKLPAKQISLVFLGLIVLPFIGFLIGVSLLSLLTRLGVNIKSFPSSVGAATSALLFHGGIGAVLLLYVLFWVKAIGSVHDSKGTVFAGSVSVVRRTQNTVSPRSSIEQAEICLKDIYSSL